MSENTTENLGVRFPLKALSIMLAATGAVVLTVGFWAARYQPAVMDRLTQEDGLFEWMTFLALAAGGIAVLVCWHLRRTHHGMRAGSLQGIGMLLVAGLFLAGAMEEISWGQRIFDWKSPEFFSSHNAQRETNLHNLKVAGVKINRLVFGKILFVMVFAHNVVLPLSAVRRPQVRRTVERLGGFLPPLPLVAVYFAIAIAAQMIDHKKAAEILECLGALHYLCSIILTYGLGHGMQRPAFAPRLASRQFAAMGSAALIVGLMCTAWLLT